MIPSLAEFIAAVQPRYQFYRHCQELISVLQRVADGELRRVLISLPPRHSKSETISRLFTAYYLRRYPARWVALTSYGADLAYTLSRAARENYAQSGGELHPASRAVRHWQTTSGGGLWATGVGGPATGKGFHLGIIDDPLKDAEQAASPVIRAKQQDWYSSVFSTREEPDGAVIILQTRWHEDDLTGYVLGLEAEDAEHWYVVNLPAIAEEVSAPPPSCTVHPDWRAPGEPLCPERYPISRLRKMEARIGPFFFGALFQQRPAPRDGGLFTRAAAILPATPGDIIARVRYWDKAGARPGKGDWTVGALLALRANGRILVEDVVRFQAQAGERNRRIRETGELDVRRHGARVIQWVEQPPGDGVEATQAVIAALAGIPAFADPVHGDKVSRAEPFAAQWQIDRVDLLTGAWNRAYLDELRAFPNGHNDDQADASAGAYRKLQRGTPTRQSNYRDDAND
jgi:predicted phage terminase large subunit-like protein